MTNEINYTQMQNDAKKFGKSLDVSDRTRGIAESAYMSGEVFMAKKMLDAQKNESSKKEIDWEQRRYEIAKQMYIERMRYSLCTMEEDAKKSVRYADTLIEELKRQGNI